ncbi:hypothetical protein RISK_002690 [Rhodopirellula islandica]|uniref:Uncharacterized protein n=1 Tax=Rhodopirellula islandica TaxID=595434 RepID=A0A0J1BFH3_RHOIS|nr:hypothetical protein RISK_002690 [Rhodopirellula islandica]
MRFENFIGIGLPVLRFRIDRSFHTNDFKGGFVPAAYQHGRGIEHVLEP